MRTAAAAAITCLFAVASLTAQTSASDVRARDIFKQLIEINTTDSVGNVTTAANAMAVRLRAAGFPATDVQVIGPDPRKGNLILRWRGASSTGARKPLLLLAHLDVVEAKREDWSFDPFVFLEKDGFFYGRGTSDDKAMAAQFVANLIRLKEEGYAPDRDLILALTADEEGGTFNGVDWLVKNHRDLIDAEFAINEGGGGNMRKGKYLTNEVQASEKVFQDFRLEVTNPGGHSSLPVKDNAIYHLSEGLARLARFEFPVQLNEVTRAYFERSASVESDPKVAADMRAVARATPDLAAAARLSAAVPYWNSMMRTTCVATRLAGGHANNALPQLADANVNCRILPGVSPASVRDKLVEVLADPKINVSFVGEATPSKPSPLRPDVMNAVESLTKEMFPGVVVVPVMSTGATDGLYLRNGEVPTYGIDGTFGDMDDVRAHGRDERVGVKQFLEGLEFQYRLIKALSSPSQSSAATPRPSQEARPVETKPREARPVETKPARVDAIFSRFTTPASPGCALAVVQNGTIAYEQGYGRASLELDVPITPQTVFDIGSTSKQFTAFALLLLERDGKLSLDDDIRKYVPEVPDYGKRITIRHLLSHTSGLRDYTDLLEFDGHDTADFTGDRDALDLIARQRGVNFSPGEEWRYSNTGFFLASIIVQRASGQSLASFARGRIFEPLGMTSTQYLDDTTRVVPKRATAYSPGSGGFRVNMSDWNQTGDGAVQTTVEDLARWDENFYAPKVGDARMLQAMQTAGRLNNSKTHEYGLGLSIATYGGLHRVSHGGSWAGYRADLMRFPERHTSIITLCNVSNSGPTMLAESVAAVWLADAGLTPPSPSASAGQAPAPRAATPPPPAPPRLSDEDLRAHAGRYASPELTLPWNIDLVNHELRVRIRKGSGEALTPISRDEFRWGGTRITFERDALIVTNRGVEKLRLTKVAQPGS